MSTLATFISSQWLYLGVFKRRNERTKYSNLVLKIAFGLKRKLMAKDLAREPATLLSSTRTAWSFSVALRLKIEDSTIPGF